MNAEFLRELLAKQPFVPFEIRLTNGETYEIRHPEFAFVLKTRMAIGYPDSDQLAICAILHIASVRTLQAA